MTPICSEHAALLKRIAKYPEDHTGRKVYADWLQEREEICWVIVANYHPFVWPTEFGSNDQQLAYTTNKGASYHQTTFGLPWLEGKVKVKPYQNFKVGFRWIMEAFANGEAK